MKLCHFERFRCSNILTLLTSFEVNMAKGGTAAVPFVLIEGNLAYLAKCIAYKLQMEPPEI